MLCVPSMPVLQKGQLIELQACLHAETGASANVQVGQFEGIIQHCLSHAPGVHVIDLPINYAVSAQLQVSAL